MGECSECYLGKQVDMLRKLAYPAYRLADGCGYPDGKHGPVVCRHPDVQPAKGVTRCYEYTHLTCPAYKKLFEEV